MSAHLGPRVSALLDGQLSAEEAERAWEHVHACHHCRDQVEREGWVKTRLASSSLEPGPAPDALKGALLAGGFAEPAGSRGRRAVGIAAIGGSAAGAAVMGVLALGVAPADVPNPDRRAPSSQVTTPAQPTAKLPLRPTRSARPGD